MAAFPQGKTAFIVIHGIGEQNPFETLDGFGRGLIDLLQRRAVKFKLHHKLHCHDSWTESYLQISQPRSSRNRIDLHEVYWAYLTENQISVAEIRAWLEQTLAGVNRFFSENQHLIQAYEQADQVAQLQRLNQKLRWGARLYRPAAFVLDLLQPFKAFSGGWLEKLSEQLFECASPYLTGYLGDVAIYTSTDRKSKFFNLRQQILRDSLEMIRSVLKDDSVERVILCGHSLGSAIAYDSLNRLQIERCQPDCEALPLEKIAGLVTFGSPLDKIAFFFRQHADQEQWLRRAFLDHLHSFKAKPLDLNGTPIPVSDPVEHSLDQIPWLNFWDRNDPISGPLNLYDLAPEENIELRMGEKWGVAHLGYWGEERMYEVLGERLLGNGGGYA